MGQMKTLLTGKQIDQYLDWSLIGSPMLFHGALMEHSSRSTLFMAADKLPEVLNKVWWLYVDDKDKHWLDLIIFVKWLSRMAFMQKSFSVFKGKRKEEDSSNKK